MLLSEIHPLGASDANPFIKLRQRLNPMIQAIVWYQLFTPEELKEFTERAAMPYDEVMALIEAKARSRGQALLVRDWTHLDYTPSAVVADPPYRLRTAEFLTNRFEVIHTATVRHPIDQWLSLSADVKMRGNLTLEGYLLGCRRFAETCQNIGFLRYEDFVREPPKVTEELCRRLELPYDPAFIRKWPDFHKITGDGLGKNFREIRVMPRRRVEPALLEEFGRNEDYRETLRLLGYEHPEPIV